VAETNKIHINVVTNVGLQEANVVGDS